MTTEPMTLTLTSCGQAQAEALARDLVERSVAACVSCLPQVKSVYRWKGEVACETEVLLLIKTPSSRHKALITALEELHPYETPEVVSWHSDHVSEAYLAWAQAETLVRPTHS